MLKRHWEIEYPEKSLRNSIFKKLNIVIYFLIYKVRVFCALESHRDK